MDLTLWITMCLLASVGLVQALGWLIGLFGRPPGVCRSCHVIPLKGDPDLLEQQIRYELLQLRWSLPCRSVPLVLLDLGLGEEEREICNRMLRGVGGVFVCEPHQLPTLIRRLDKLLYPKEKDAKG